MKSILGQSPQPNQAIGFSRWHPVAKSPFSRRGAHTLLAVGLLASTLLTGCSSTPAPTPTPTPLIAGKFATEEEALAAAKEVYLKYAALSEQLAQAPTSDSSALRKVTSAELYEIETATAETLVQHNLKAFGSVNYWGFEFVESDEKTVIMNICSDNTGTRLLDDEGADFSAGMDKSIAGYRVVVRFGEEVSIVQSLDLRGDELCAR